MTEHRSALRILDDNRRAMMRDVIVAFGVLAVIVLIIIAMVVGYCIAR